MTDMTPGLPAYNFDSLLKLAGFASISMLKSERRQLTENQRPVGQYWSGHAWVMLYRVADTVDMPPLSPGRQRLYDKNRTCAMCGTKRRDPFPKGRDGDRYCGACQRPAGERLWRWEREADRPTAIEWARGVLADPNAFLAARERHEFWHRDLAVALDGTVLLDVEIRFNVSEPYEDHPQRQALQLRSPLAAVDKTQALRGRRMVAWWPNAAPDLATSFGDYGWPTERAARVEEGDALGRWYDRWVGQIRHEDAYLSNHPTLMQHAPPPGAEECIARMRAILAEIAAGEPPTFFDSHSAAGGGSDG